MVVVDESFLMEIQRPKQPSRAIYTRGTASTVQQSETERECAPYFVNLSQLPASQIEHLRETGLLVVVAAVANDDEPEEEEDSPLFRVALLRDKHESYLQTIWSPPPPPAGNKLRPSFVSLDASRTWMIYWCLHAVDVMGRISKQNQQWQPPQTQTQPAAGVRVDQWNDRMVDTLRTCFTHSTVRLDCAIVEQDPLLRQQQLRRKQQQQPTHRASGKETEDGDCCRTSTESSSSSSVSLDGGGFGGGPDQLPHVATTYAAVLALCILASSSASADIANGDDDDKDSPTTHPRAAALALLHEIRTPLYVWLVSLHDHVTGSFRMHADGEIDVRATYCVVVIAKLLNLLTPTLRHQTANYVVQCQTWEGGFGSEPGAEAHGGYTYCAVAALALLDELRTVVDLSATAGWLARRQMSYEGGYSGRANKLVDGCYSFWQGSAMTIISHALQTQNQQKKDDTNCHQDPWLSDANSTTELKPSLFDSAMLERYVLLCTQDVNGGLRDKPSKGRDYYHSCYCLSGLSIAQHYGPGPHFGHVTQASVHRTHPCYNIRVEHVAFALAHFQNCNVNNTETHLRTSSS